LTDVTVRGAVSHDARTGGDGLKTVSSAKRLTVLGGRYYSNAQDGIDLYAGCDEAMLIGVTCRDNTVNGVDIKQGTATELEATFGYRRRIAIIGGNYDNNTEVGIKIYGDPAALGYFQDPLVMGANIIGNQQYGIHCRAVSPRILGNLLLGNAVSSAASYSVIYLQGDATTQPSGGVIANNTIGNNGVSGSTNTGINVLEWDGVEITGNTIENNAARPEAQELDIGIITSANSVNVHIHANTFGALNTNKVQISAGSVVLGHNTGIPLKTRGTATILSGNTTVAVTHGAAGRPAAYSQVRFWPLGNQNGGGFPYTGATSTTQINPTTAVAVSADTLIGWEVDLTDAVLTYGIVY
jgi:hypothetical protein